MMESGTETGSRDCPPDWWYQLKDDLLVTIRSLLVEVLNSELPKHQLSGKDGSPNSAGTEGFWRLFLRGWLECVRALRVVGARAHLLLNGMVSYTWVHHSHAKLSLFMFSVFTFVFITF